MSCPPTCGPGNASRWQIAAGASPNASQRTMHLSMNRSGGGTGMQQNLSRSLPPMGAMPMGHMPMGPMPMGTMPMGPMPPMPMGPMTMSPVPQQFSPMPMPRTPQMQSTPGQCAYPCQHETFGSQIDHNLSWMPQDVNLSSFQSADASSRYRQFEQNVNPFAGQYLDQSQDANVTGFSFGQQENLEGEGGDKEKKKEHEETLMEWFDRTVENEMKKRKEKSLDTGTFSPIQQEEGTERDLGLAKNILGKLGEASASEIEIITQMRMQPDTELTDAVDKLAKAEAMCHFAGAVKAAEKAAENAPPGLAEEAAVASARLFHTEMKATSNVNETLAGVRPLEVVGYVGVTNPKFPVKPKKKECHMKC